MALKDWKYKGSNNRKIYKDFEFVTKSGKFLQVYFISKNVYFVELQYKDVSLILTRKSKKSSAIKFAMKYMENNK
jgi:hypothetical protein